MSFNGIWPHTIDFISVDCAAENARPYDPPFVSAALTWSLALAAEARERVARATPMALPLERRNDPIETRTDYVGYCLGSDSTCK